MPSPVFPPPAPYPRPERFFLDLDGSAHWYIVPEARRAEWDAWTSLSEDDEASWDVPDYAKRIGSPSSVTFTNPCV